LTSAFGVITIFSSRTESRRFLTCSQRVRRPKPVRLGKFERYLSNIGWGVTKMASKYRYEIIIYWSPEDEAYVAEVPELPGCAADGSTYAETVANVEVVIDEWISTAIELGREIPEPKGRLMFA
jgi:predicted RNase H-like HicB family nuclease